MRGKKKIKKTGAFVEIKNLSFSYHKNHEALRNVSLSVAAGERFGIIGPTGAGKSTLLLHLNGILNGRGEIFVDGMQVISKTLPVIRKKVGIVFQNPDDQLFNPTVEEDVAFGPLNFGMSRSKTSTMVREVLAVFGLSGFEKMSSHHMSYGEKKRVALATVMVMKPEVIALDEPFSNLDPAMVQQLISLIKKLPATVILVSQSILPTLAVCEKMAVMKDGAVVKIGKTADIAKDSKLLRSCGLDFRFFCDICRKYKS